MHVSRLMRLSNVLRNKGGKTLSFALSLWPRMEEVLIWAVVIVKARMRMMESLEEWRPIAQE